MATGTARRPRIAPTDDWPTLQLRFAWPEQRAYELIRPVVLFGRSPVERAGQTGVTARTIYRKARRFDAAGMAGLAAAAPGEDGRKLPAAIREAVRALKAEHPGFRPHELATICYARFGRRPSPHTVRRVLAEEPVLVEVARRSPPYAQIADPAERRLAIVRLHAEGWTVQSIAEYLQTNRARVYETLRRWIDEGVAGLADKSSAPAHPARKVDLKAIATVRELQENPELGEFRVHAALKRLGIELSPRTCGRILALNRGLYGLPKPSRSPREPQAMPFKARRRHEYWTVDVRYLDHQLDEGKVYVISVLDNYSRAILSSALSRTQDLTAYLIVLYAAIAAQGSPEALVSDGGGIFRATRAMQIYEALGIRKEQIDRRQAWQSYIETHFNVQRRMADHRFAKAESWAELQDAHDRWVADYNYQEHWAHRDRPDGRRSPVEVLGWVAGARHEPALLHRVFSATRFGRRFDRLGYVRFRHWRVYGERGLARRAGTVWLAGETLTVAFADEALAHYQVAYQPDRTHFRDVTAVDRVETRFRSPQLPLWEFGIGDWRLRPGGTRRLPEPAPRAARRAPGAVQAPMFPEREPPAAQPG